MDEDGLASTDGGISVDDVTIVLLLLEVEVEWGLGAVVVPIVFEMVDERENNGLDEFGNGERALFPALSGSR